MGTMTVYRSRIHLMHAYLLLAILLPAAASLPFCTRLYGNPEPASCDQLLYGDDTYSGYTGIGNTDQRDHLFALPLTRRPLYATDDQWSNKVNLPIVRSNLRCKLALIPLVSLTGAISSDSSHYRDIAFQGNLIQNTCMHPHNQPTSGGHTLAGTNARLLLILYARNSDFDNQVRRRIALGEPVLGMETADGSIVPGTVSAADEASSSTRSPSLDRVDATGVVDKPTCGRDCSGPGNICDEASGCRCIADAWQGVGSAFYTGKCKVPYRSATASFVSSADGRELLGSAAAVQLTNATLSMTSNDSTIIEGGLTADMACPCNCTYVSRACCTSTTGIVHEAPALKLGMLKAPNSTLVCDGRTGRFRSP